MERVTAQVLTEAGTPIPAGELAAWCAMWADGDVRMRARRWEGPGVLPVPRGAGELWSRAADRTIGASEEGTR